MKEYEDIQGHAIYDFWTHGKSSALKIHNNYGLPEKMPVEAFFRSHDDMPDLEKWALQICRGEILDAGAGAGRHSLLLQNAGKSVTALEVSPLSAEVMRQRGVEKVIEQDYFSLPDKKWDTVLMLMNGIGFAGDLKKLEHMLQYTKKLLHPGGQWIFDSSDISYLYHHAEVPKDAYYGEIRYRFEYQKMKGPWFKWLYIDKHTMAKMAKKAGWNMQIIYENDQDEYLSRMILS